MARPALLYSGGCPVCRWLVRNIILKLDTKRELDIVPIRHPHANHLFGKMSLERRIQNWWYVETDGSLWEGNHGGGLFMLLLFPRTAWIGRLVIQFDKVHWLNKLDDWVKHNRPRIAPWLTDGPAYFRVGEVERWLQPDSITEVQDDTQ
jgi:predicted DCC family thiol-disulfide oxidoreductase YuxK